MKVRYQADADLRKAIVIGVMRREPAIDFRTAQSAALQGLSDTDVLQQAARDGRVLVSHDFGSMPRHFTQFVETHSSPGVFDLSEATRRRGD